MIKYLKTSGLALAVFWVTMEIIKPGWTVNVLLGLDVFANTLLWGDVETISLRMGKQEDANPIARKVCAVLDLFDKDHCAKTVENNL